MKTSTFIVKSEILIQNNKIKKINFYFSFEENKFEEA